jgi:hypothetical protein
MVHERVEVVAEVVGRWWPVVGQGAVLGRHRRRLADVPVAQVVVARRAQTRGVLELDEASVAGIAGQGWAARA